MTAAAGFGLSGCTSPTYGTGKSQGSQLLDDVSNIASFGPGKNQQHIDYKPRPDLVRPGAGDKGQLPPPQQSVAGAGDPNWPESPEQRRKRLRDEITAKRDEPGYVSPVEPDGPVNDSSRLILPTGASRSQALAARNQAVDPARVEAYKKARAEQNQGSATNRKYLSEPPLTYRQPAATAPTGELGEDEAKKERERKKAMGGSKGWKDYLPWN